MRKRLTVLIMMIPVMLISLGARKSEVMFMPPPIEVPDTVSHEDVVKIVENALTGRGWTLDDKTASESGKALTIDTTLTRGVHVVKIEVEINGKSIRMRYVESTKMGYQEKKGKKHIHPNYGGWLQRLQADIWLAFIDLR